MTIGIEYYIANENIWSCLKRMSKFFKIVNSFPGESLQLSLSQFMCMNFTFNAAVEEIK